MRGRNSNRAQIVKTKEEKTPTVAELSERAMETMTARFVPNAKDPSVIRVEGPCPNCRHQTKWDSPLKFLRTDTGVSRYKLPFDPDIGVGRGLARLAGRPSGRFLEDSGLGKIVITATETEFSMKCACGEKGRDHKDGSCNAEWNMRVAKP